MTLIPTPRFVGTGFWPVLVLVLSVVLIDAPTARAADRISSLQPRTGTPGAAVRIYGTGFGATAADNAVTFGGVAATVDSVGTGGGVLYVRVPSGVSGPVPVAVTSGGQTATSVRPFAVAANGFDFLAEEDPGQVSVLFDVRSGESLTGDVDNNGRLDVFVCGGTSRGERSNIHLNDGTGRYPGRSSPFTDLDGCAAVIGDFNLDGNLDIHANGIDRGNLLGADIYLGDGTGGFSVTGSGPVGRQRGDIAIGDVDGDGIVDLFSHGSADPSSEVPSTTLYLGDGAGGFGASSVTFEALGFGSASEMADVDNDGDLDIVAVGRNSNLSPSASLYRNDGPDTFPSVSVPFTPVGSGASVAVGDVDGNGGVDVLITGRASTGPSATLYLNDGTGTFTVANVSLTGVENSSATIADVNSDGLKDLIVTGLDDTSTPTSTVYWGDGQGGFTPDTAVLTPVQNGSTTVEDLDADGDLDLILHGQRADGEIISWIYRAENVTITDVVPTIGTSGTPVQIYGKAFGPTPAENTVTFDGVRAPVDSVATGVLYARVPTGASGATRLQVTNTAAFKGRNATATTAGTFDVVSRPGLRFVDVQAGLTGVRQGAAAAEDVNGDGFADLLITGQTDAGSPTATLYRREGRGGPSLTTESFAGVRLGSATLADVTGDGALDALITGADDTGGPTATLYEGDGQGEFQASALTFGGMVESSAFVTDLNEDGRPDVYIAGAVVEIGDFSNQEFYETINNDTFRSVTVVSGGADGSLSVTDFTGNGSLDILTTGRREDRIIAEILTNDGYATFQRSFFFLPLLASASVFTDVNSDGRDDAVITGRTSNNVALLHIYFGPNPNESDPDVELDGTSNGSISAGDLDGDGAIDLLLTGDDADGAPQTLLYLGDGQGGFTEASTSLPDVGGGSTSTLTDVDGDGDLDVLLTGIDASGAYIARLYRNGLLLSKSFAPGRPLSLGRAATTDTLSRVFALENRSVFEQVIDVTVDAGAVFTLGSAGATDTTLTIPVGGSVDLPVRFAPDQDGVFRDTIHLAAQGDVLAEESSVVPLNGEGVVVRGVTAAAPARAGAPLDVLVPTPANLEPSEGQLFVRRTGQRAFQQQTFAPAAPGETVAVEIPDSLVTGRGVDLYTRLVELRPESPDLAVTFPVVEPAANPARLRVRLDSSRATGAFLERAYRMVSVPYDLGARTVREVFASSYGPYDDEVWRLLRYDPAAGRYRDLPDLDASLRPGDAYWLVTDAGAPLRVDSLRSTGATEAVALPLAPGWNQIGVPYAFPVAWADVQGTAAVSAPVGYDADRPEGEAYRFNEPVLTPWAGYFVFNRADSTVRITIPPLEAGDSPQAESQSVAGKAGDGRYRLRLQAAMADGDRVLWDRQAWLAFDAAATTGLGPEDTPKPPPVGDVVRLGIESDADGGPLLAGSVKPVGDGGQSWDVRLTASVDEPYATDKRVRLRLSEDGQRPDGYERFVLDLDRGRRLAVQEDGTEILLSADRPVRRLRVIVGTADYAASKAGSIPLEVLTTALRPPYPNPSTGPTVVEYTLEETADVQIEVFDVLGRRIDRIEQGRKPAGRYQVAWRGQNHLGRAVASGVYFLRMEAGSYRATEKIVIVR